VKELSKTKKRRLAALTRRQRPTVEVKTVVRTVRKVKPLPGPRGLAKYFTGEPPTGPIIRNSGGVSREAEWVKDTLVE
jgi:hypothetical protein